jgi:acid phosphatase (class A)
LIRYPSLGAAALLAVAACASAPTPPPRDASMAAPPQARLAGYLAPDALDGGAILGPPPAVDSAQGRADRATYDETRALAGTPRWQLAIQDNDLWNGGALKRYSCAIGRDIGEKTTPTAMRMLHRVELDVRTVGTPPKDFYNRRRPALGNDKPICVPRETWLETNASYPSGHSMAGWSWALILAEAEPAKASALLQAGREMGMSRVVCGVHYPTDVEAGRTLGAAMVARLHADPAFMADLAKAKTELASAPAPSGCGA